MTTQDPIVIVGMARTPMGGFQGDLAAASASDLGAVAIRAALERANVPAERIDEIVFGCVLPAAAAPARQAALKPGCRSRRCDHGQQDVRLGDEGRDVRARPAAGGPAGVAVAGGMESMTNAPYLLPKARAGCAWVTGRCSITCSSTAEDAYEGPPDGHVRRGLRAGVPVHARGAGCVRDRIATRAQRAIADGHFVSEIAPVTVKAGKTETVVSIDEQPGKAKLDKIPTLKPAFRDGGTVTAANASSISDARPRS